MLDLTLLTLTGKREPIAEGEANACLVSPCVPRIPQGAITMDAICEDNPGNDTTTSGRTCTCQQPGRPEFDVVWTETDGCVYSEFASEADTITHDCQRGAFID